MIDTEKIKIMTKLATYEKGRGKKDIAMNRYSRKDYIKYQITWATVAFTVAYLIGCALFLLWGIDWIIDLPKKSSYIFLFGTIFLIYIVLLFLYRKFLKKLYNKYYTAMTLRLEEYRRQLRKLQTLYEDSPKNNQYW